MNEKGGDLKTQEFLKAFLLEIISLKQMSESDAGLSGEAAF